MNTRVMAAFILLPVAIAIERFAWYASRSVLVSHAVDLGVDRAAMYQWTSVFVSVGTIVAGLIAILLLPRVLIVCGGLCAAASYFMVTSSADPDTLVICMRMAAFGAGVLKASLYALAFLVMPTPKWRALYIVLTYLLINVAGFTAGLGGPVLATTLGTTAVLISCGVAIVAATIAATVVVVVDKLAEHSGHVAATPRHHDRAVLGAMAMVGATFPLWAAMTAADRRALDLMVDMGQQVSWYGGVQTLSSVVTMLCMIGLGVVLLVREEQPRTTMIVGVGLCLGAFASLIALIPSGITASGSLLIYAIAEAVAPLALARGLANHRPRVVTLFAAFIMLFSTAAALAGGELPLVTLGVCIPILVVVGVVLIVKGNRFDDWLDAPNEKPQSWPIGHTAHADRGANA